MKLARIIEFPRRGIDPRQAAYDEAKSRLALGYRPRNPLPAERRAVPPSSMRGVTRPVSELADDNGNEAA